MIQKVQITTVYKNDKKKDGSLYTIKNGKNAGKNFIRIGIKTEQTGEDVFYANVLPTDKKYNTIEVGQTLLLNLYESTTPEGGVFKNFKFPSKDELAEFALKNS